MNTLISFLILKKQETLSLKKKAAADKRNSMSKCWLDAVLYTVEGDNYFKQLAIDGSTAEDDEKPEFGSKWYDGELQTPICITLPGKKVSECKFIFDATDSCEPDQFKEYMYGTYVGDSYVFSDAWGGSVDFGDGEYHGLSIEFVVRVYPNRTLEVSDYTVMWNDENLHVETRVSKYWLQDMLNKASQRNFRKIWAREKAKAAVPESM